MQIDINILKSALTLIEIQLGRDLPIVSDEEGWHIKAIDPSHVSFSSVDIPAASFTGYVPWGEISVDLDKLAKAIAGKGNTPDLVLGDGILTVRGNGLTTKIRLNAEYPERPRALPAFESEATVILNSTELKQIVKATDDQMALTIEVSEAGLTISGYDEDGTGSQLDIAADACVAIDGEARARYPLGMIKGLCKALPDKTEVEVGFSTNCPAVFKYDLSGANCCWIVAPWVEED